MLITQQCLVNEKENQNEQKHFNNWYNNDNGGAAVYPPSVKSKIVLLGSSQGLVSSRRIAETCETNITFMSLSGDE